MKPYPFKGGDASDAVFDTMMRRPTVRGFRRRAAPHAHIAECLAVPPFLGANHSCEAFIYALNVSGIDQGFYRYSATSNSLQLVSETDLPDAGVLMCGDDSANNAAAIVFLVARFDRIMSTCQDPTTYRVLIIEAGHIGQHIAATAARHGLAANPTAAIQDSLVEQALRLTPPMEGVVYAMTVGYPDR